MDSGKRKERPKSRLTRLQKGLLAAACCLAVALAGTALYRSVFVRPELPDRSKAAEEKAETVDYGDGIRPRADGERKSGDYYTVLILGRDTGGGGNTDTMLLASYDVTNQKAAVMSIPRDTMVNVSWDVKKINSVYNANGQGEKGIQALYREISQLVGFEPDYQVIVEWEAVGEIVDAIGGVWFDVPYDMDYHDPYQDLVIEQAAGYRLLSGEDAMQVIRWRGNDNDSPYGYRKSNGGIGDSGRMEVQQAFLKAVIQQLMQPANVLHIGEIAQVFQENVETDLSFQNILWFGKQALTGGLSVENVEFLTMPWQGANVYSRTESRRLGRYVELAYVVPIAGQLLEIVNQQLSPFAQTFTRGDLDIMYVNSDGSVGSTTGRLEDSQAAHPKSYWQAQWAPQPPAETPETPQPEEPDAIPPETGGNQSPGEETDPGAAAPETPQTPAGGSDSAGGEVSPGTGEPEAPPAAADPGGNPETGAEDPAEPDFTIISPPEAA